MRSGPIPDSGKTVLKSGVFSGLSIAQVYKLSTREAAAKGYTHGDGRAYVLWLASDQNRNAYTRDRATTYFASCGADAWLHAHAATTKRAEVQGLGKLAEYESSCPVCGAHIVIGARIVYLPSNGPWVCGHCYEVETGVSPEPRKAPKVAT